METIISGIYKIEDTLTGNVYVGASTNILKRWSNHLAKFRGNRHDYPELQIAWNLDRNRIRFEILEESYKDSSLNARENYFIGYCEAIDGWKVINKEQIARRTGRVIDTAKMKAAQSGEGNGHSFLTTDDVVKIKRLLQMGVRQWIIANTFGVKNTQISRINTGRRWGSVSL
ncbi:GIY-YIG nuclease family protein [Desulfosporosinus metallidurans]|uniref:GIY-YIG nuclease family protein n=1 Tax=Desulfosporosinus metallidurans TaxID=1888891 RepID=UPI00094C11E5|nr:GIY-YIG nuclease family protein [Desulfosporosinus metallidurans]